MCHIRQRLALYFALPILCLLPSMAGIAPRTYSNANEALASIRGGQSPRGPFCGLSCFYFAARACGRSVLFTDLFNNRYIDDPRGSSITNLQAAANDYQIYSFAVGNIDENFLLGSSFPTILHVRSAADNFEFNHFILYLGEKAGMARVYDPLTPSHLVPFDELMARSDGLALVLSSTPISERTLMARQMGGMLRWSAALLVLVVVVAFADEYSALSVGSIAATSKQALRQILKLLTIAATAAGLSQFVGNTSALAGSQGAIAMIQRENVGSLLPQVDTAQMQKRIGENGTVIIDARYAEDYLRDHIPGAISIPINSTRNERQAVMKGIRWNENIIVYCESDQCRFSDEIAGALLDDGYARLSIYRDGWRGWEANSQR
jgi:rhodanese-related sulfurtransferase